MIITRRDASMGATAAAVAIGAAAAPRTVKAALADDPVITSAWQLRAASAAWLSAEDAFEAACHRVGIDERGYDGPVSWWTHRTDLVAGAQVTFERRPRRCGNARAGSGAGSLAPTVDRVWLTEGNVAHANFVSAR